VAGNYASAPRTASRAFERPECP